MANACHCANWKLWTNKLTATNWIGPLHRSQLKVCLIGISGLPFTNASYWLPNGYVAGLWIAWIIAKFKHGDHSSNQLVPFLLHYANSAMSYIQTLQSCLQICAPCPLHCSTMASLKNSLHALQSHTVPCSFAFVFLPGQWPADV